ncbi:MAG: outer membrane protein assembly factor BamD, partial [Gelidibacter sp.]
FREEAMYYRFDSAYRLGINSIERKRQERLNIALKYYNAFVKAYPESQHSAEAAQMNAELQTAIQNYTIKS